MKRLSMDQVFHQLLRVRKPLKGYGVIENVLAYGDFKKDGKSLSSAAFRTLVRMVLMNYGRRSDSIEPSVEYMACRFGTPVQTLYKHLSELEDFGLIKRKNRSRTSRTSRPGEKASNVYTFAPYAVRVMFHVRGLEAYLEAGGRDRKEYDRLFEAFWAEYGPKLIEQHNPSRMTWRDLKGPQKDDATDGEGTTTSPSHAVKQAKRETEIIRSIARDQGSAQNTIASEVAALMGGSVSLRVIREYCARWNGELGMSGDVIRFATEHACGYVTPTPAYVESILNDWHKKGIKTVEAAQRDIEKYKENQQRHRAARTKGNAPSPTPDLAKPSPVPQKGRYDRLLNRNKD